MLVSYCISGLLIIFWGKLLLLTETRTGDTSDGELNEQLNITESNDIFSDKLNNSPQSNKTLLPAEESNSDLETSPLSLINSNNTAHIPAIREYLRHEDVKKSSSRSQQGHRQAVSAKGDIGPSLQSVQMAAAVA